MGEDGESPKFHTHQKPSGLKNDVSSTLLKKGAKNYYERKREKKKKREKRRERRNHKTSSSLNLLLSPWPINTICVYDLALVFA